MNHATAQSPCSSLSAEALRQAISCRWRYPETFIDKEKPAFSSHARQLSGCRDFHCPLPHVQKSDWTGDCQHERCRSRDKVLSSFWSIPRNAAISGNCHSKFANLPTISDTSIDLLIALSIFFQATSNGSERRWKRTFSLEEKSQIAWKLFKTQSGEKLSIELWATNILHIVGAFS